MKKLILTVSLLMACVIWADEDVAAIKGLYKSWNEAVEASNIDGYINSLDDNITLIPPDGPIIIGFFLARYSILLRIKLKIKIMT